MNSKLESKSAPHKMQNCHFSAFSHGLHSCFRPSPGLFHQSTYEISHLQGMSHKRVTATQFQGSVSKLSGGGVLFPITFSFPYPTLPYHTLPHPHRFLNTNTTTDNNVSEAKTWFGSFHTCIYRRRLKTKVD